MKTRHETVTGFCVLALCNLLAHAYKNVIYRGGITAAFVLASDCFDEMIICPLRIGELLIAVPDARKLLRAVILYLRFKAIPNMFELVLFTVHITHQEQEGCAAAWA